MPARDDAERHGQVAEEQPSGPGLSALPSENPIRPHKQTAKKQAPLPHKCTCAPLAPANLGQVTWFAVRGYAPQTAGSWCCQVRFLTIIFTIRLKKICPLAKSRFVVKCDSCMNELSPKRTRPAMGLSFCFLYRVAARPKDPCCKP